MPCGCIPIIVDPPVSCRNCLIVKDLRFRCDQGPVPCGDTDPDGVITVDLAQYNDVSACGSGGHTYSLISYDAVGLQNVTLSAGGVLTAQTMDIYEDHVEYKITYRVSCSDPDSILSAIGIVYVCMKNPCDICPDGEQCDPCTGDCVPIVP